MSRPSMRYVALKTVEQQDIQAVYPVRASLIGERTAKANQLRRSKLQTHDRAILDILKAIRELTKPAKLKRRGIGLTADIGRKS